MAQAPPVRSGRRSSVRSTYRVAGRGFVGRFMSVRKGLEYAGGQPGRVARVENRLWGWLFGLGVLSRNAARLEVRGRRSGRRITLPVAIVHHAGERYLVAMLGAWVSNG